MWTICTIYARVIDRMDWHNLAIFLLRDSIMELDIALANRSLDHERDMTECPVIPEFTTSRSKTSARA